MKHHSQLTGFERRLGMGTGPRQLCPVCHGTGSDDSEARLDIMIPRWMNDVSATLHAAAGYAPPSTTPEPDPATLPGPVRCGLCAGTGAAAIAAVRADAARAEVGNERAFAQMRLVAERLGRVY